MGWCEKCEADCNPCGCIDDEIDTLRARVAELEGECRDLRTQTDMRGDQCDESIERAVAAEEEVARLRGLLGECVEPLKRWAWNEATEEAEDLARRVREAIETKGDQ